MSTDKFYGKFRGEVVNTKDPDKCGRIKFKCPSVLGDNISAWALPCFPPNISFVPQIGDLVWVEFEEGKREEPIWVGVFYTPSQWVKKFAPTYSDSVSFISTPDLLECKSDTVIELRTLKDGIRIESAKGTEIISKKDTIIKANKIKHIEE